jgi:hypothetical protein
MNKNTIVKKREKFLSFILYKMTIDKSGILWYNPPGTARNFNYNTLIEFLSREKCDKKIKYFFLKFI